MEIELSKVYEIWYKILRLILGFCKFVKYGRMYIEALGEYYTSKNVTLLDC